MRTHFRHTTCGVLALALYVLLMGCGDKPDHNANWYYYWENDRIVPALQRTGSPASRWDWSVKAANKGVYGAAHGPSDGFVLTDLCITHPAMSSIQVTHKTRPLTFKIGAATTYGIQQAAATAVHERQHILNWKQINGGQPDTDMDGLADSEENRAPYFFNIGDRDTYDVATAIASGYATYGENEFVARMAENAGVSALDLSTDWSEGGAQWQH